MTKPKLNVHLIISQNEITMLDMTTGAGVEDRDKITDGIGKLITLRNFIEAKILDFEKDMQQSFRKKVDPKPDGLGVVWSDNTTGDVKKGFDEIDFNNLKT